MFGASSKCKLRGPGVLGDGLGSLGDGVLGQLSGQEETDGSLDLASAAMRSKMSLTKEFMMDMATEDTPVSDCTCFDTF